MGTKARFVSPGALALTKDLRLLVADYSTHSIRIIELASQTVSTLIKAPEYTVNLAMMTISGEAGKGAGFRSLVIAAQGRHNTKHLN